MMLISRNDGYASPTAAKDHGSQIDEVPNDVNLMDVKWKRARDHPARTMNGLRNVPIGGHDRFGIEHGSDGLCGPVKRFVLKIDLNMGQHNGRPLWSAATSQNGVQLQGKFVT
ncbi:MAG: hypothetical protein VW872_06465, partial [Candidatus Poseidoniales archaeon]